MPDFQEFDVKLIVTENYAKYSTSIPILENVENRAYYGRSAARIEEVTPIQYDIEQGEFATNNDYVYYFSIQFGK